MSPIALVRLLPIEKTMSGRDFSYFLTDERRDLYMLILIDITNQSAEVKRSPETS